MVYSKDITELEIADIGAVTDTMEHEEVLLLLRRELAFIAEEYCTFLVAYYHENRSIKEIAQQTNLSETAVKQRLFRARNKLKEEIHMAREFGIRSYNPEEISFVNNCNVFGSRGQPWSILEHAMYKNIFLEIYDHPETAKKIAMSLGIALPRI